MSSTFEYLGPVARAYRRVLESEEIQNPRMDDSERKLFYLDEIKRLERTLKHFQQNRGYVAGQEYAMSCIKRTIEKYKGEVERIEGAEEIARSNAPKPQTQQPTFIASEKQRYEPNISGSSANSVASTRKRGMASFDRTGGGGEEN